MKVIITHDCVSVREQFVREHAMYRRWAPITERPVLAENDTICWTVESR
jgi:hypothetical protein